MNRLCEAARPVSGQNSLLRAAFAAEHSRRVVLTALLVAAAAWLFPATLLAVPINYGDFMGDTVTYVMVQEDSNSGDTLPLFGAPTVSNDSLDFNPVGFGASTSGGGVDVTDGNLAFMVVAKPGKAIANIKFNEFGDTTLAGFGNDATFTSVTMDGILNINQVDGAGINTISIPFTMAFAPSGGNYGLLTDGGGGPLFNTIWSGMAFVDVTQELINHNISFNLGATKISVNLDNTLVAISQVGTSALIAKKDHVIITTNIPEPTSCLLAMFGLVAGAVLTRRSR